jgi:hypothetical protein
MLFVSRIDMFHDGMSEVLEEDLDVRLPLQICFNNEEAVDLGGPRKEFLEEMLKQVFS